MLRLSLIPFLLLSLATALPARAGGPGRTDGHAAAHAANRAAADADTTIRVAHVQVTAIKQGRVLRSEPVASTIVGSRQAERDRIDALKRLSSAVPNLHIPDYGSRMTSSIYVRGLGARIDQPVIGLNIDNVPVLSKECYDVELADIERIEVLRGPQSTLYGRNTMGGVINVYTRSPFTSEGVRLMAEYGSGATWRLRASTYYRPRPGLGISVTGYYSRSGGLYENLHTGRKCDREESGGGRWRLQWRNGRGLEIDNTLSFSVLDQGGYPYAYAGCEPLLDRYGEVAIRPGEIRYNDPAGYRRTALNNGFTIRYDTGRFTLSSITSYQYSDDEMKLDQDFTPLSYFTLRQARRDHAVTEDLVLRSRGGRRYSWLAGLFLFYRHGTMDAPVRFKRDGIERLILQHANDNDPAYDYTWDRELLDLESRFRLPTAGGAIYHESGFTAGRWRFTAGLRLDVEHARMRYRNRTEATYTKTHRETGTVYGDLRVDIDNRRTLKRTFAELLPKVAVLYAFDENRNLYASVSRGYKAGGFNTQMFSDVLQQQMMEQMGIGIAYDVNEVVAYDPEKSWNFELGGHFSCLDGAVRGDAALFWIECFDQQMTVFPDGLATGRMMTNAGRTRSAGGEISIMALPHRRLTLDAAYGYTDARFRRYDDGKEDYAGRHIPYAPEHTLSAGAAWTLPTGVAWLGNVVLRAGIRGAGRIRWNEANTLTQPFYALLDASVRLEHDRYTIDLWGRNLTGTRYNLFYFESIGHPFLQRGRPRTFGLTIHVNL